MTQWRSIDSGANENLPRWLGYQPCLNIVWRKRSTMLFRRHGVRYLFIGKSGAICWGFRIQHKTPIYFLRNPTENGAQLVAALGDLGSNLQMSGRLTPLSAAKTSSN